MLVVTWNLFTFLTGGVQSGKKTCASCLYLFYLGRNKWSMTRYMSSRLPLCPVHGWVGNKMDTGCLPKLHVGLVYINKLCCSMCTVTWVSCSGKYTKSVPSRPVKKQIQTHVYMELFCHWPQNPPYNDTYFWNILYIQIFNADKTRFTKWDTTFVTWMRLNFQSTWHVQQAQTEIPKVYRVMWLQLQCLKLPNGLKWESDRKEIQTSYYVSSMAHIEWKFLACKQFCLSNTRTTCVDTMLQLFMRVLLHYFISDI